MAHGLKSGHIQLGPQRVRVRVVRDLHKKETIYGDVDCAKNIIRLAGDVADTQAVDALLHEVGHFVTAECPLSRRNWESVASAVGRGFAGLLRDNPKWVESILKIFREEAKCQLKSTRKRKQTTRGAQKRKAQRRCRATRPI